MAVTLLNFDAACFEGDTVPVTAADLAAYFDNLNGRTVVVFPDGADETAAVTRAVRMPDAYASGTLTAYICYFSAATANAIQWEVQVEAVTDGDAIDHDSATSFDTANTANPTVPATAGHIDIVAVTLTNKDSVAIGDSVRFLLRRDSDHANDSAAATAYVLWMAIVE